MIDQTVLMIGHVDSVLVERLEVVNTGRRRRWSDDEKLRIVAESFAGYRQVSAVARRHEISLAQLYAWRRALGDGFREPEEVAGFSRAVIVAEAVPETAPAVLGAAGGGRMEVVTSGGHRIIVCSDVDAAAFARVWSVLEARG